MEIEKELQRALNRNIICYDAKGKSGILSKRLVALMKVVSRRNNFGKLEKFYVPSGTKHEGIGYKLVPMKDFTDLYKQLGGELPKDKQYCILAICENCPLLGSF